MIVADATPLIHLARANRLVLLSNLYDRIAIPPSVWKEVLEPNEKRPEAHVLEEASAVWLEIRELTPKAARISTSLRGGTPLGQGEADAIALAEILGTGILMDDAVAVGVARLRGLQTRWTTSVILEARKK